MARVFRLLTFAVLAVALPVMASEDVCSAEYTAEQCQQMEGDGGGTGNPNGGGSSGCPYYLCGNAIPDVQSASDWCEATQSYKDCPIGFCRYVPCSGSNC
jgi:hypothetical protein